MFILCYTRRHIAYLEYLGLKFWGMQTFLKLIVISFDRWQIIFKAYYRRTNFSTFQTHLGKFANHLLDYIFLYKYFNIFIFQSSFSSPFPFHFPYLLFCFPSFLLPLLPFPLKTVLGQLRLKPSYVSNHKQNQLCQLSVNNGRECVKGNLLLSLHADFYLDTLIME